MQNTPNQPIGIVGAGAWGQALAYSLTQSQRDVVLWGRNIDVDFFATKPFITPTNNLAQLTQCKALMLVVPTQFLRTLLQRLKPHFIESLPLILCCKGLEIGTGLLPHQIAEEECAGHNISVLTGPSFAFDVLAGRPAALTLAAQTLDQAADISAHFSTPLLRFYLSDDRVGAEIGGAVKNVMAIACGILSGMALGESARAALITRGLAEMARLATAMGGKRETLMGLSGAGDLILTCTSPTSRNYALGLKLGQGIKLEDILADQTGVTEGVHTAKSISTLCARYKVDMPIAMAVHEVLHEGLSMQEAVARILSRPTRAECV